MKVFEIIVDLDMSIVSPTKLDAPPSSPPKTSPANAAPLKSRPLMSLWHCNGMKMLLASRLN